MRPTTVQTVLLFLLLALAAWPTLVVVSAAWSYLMGEGSVINTWQLEPPGKLQDAFLAAYRQSAPYALLVALVGVVDLQLFSRHRLTWLIAGILLPLAGVALALVFYRDPMSVMPVFALSGVALMILYRLLDILMRVVIR